MRGKGARWVATVGVLACLLLVGPAAPDGSRFGRPLPADAAGAIVPGRVMTWNLCNPCGASNVDRASEIATHAPQVIGFQEACTGDVARIRDYLEGLYGLRYHVEYGPVLRNWGRCGGLPWRADGFGNALLSATPMTDRSAVEYPDGGSEDRGYLAVTTTVGDRRVRVFNTHLAQRRQEGVRSGQTAVLAAAVAPYRRAVVLGDFNARPDSAELTGIWALASDSDPACRPPSSEGCEPTTDWRAKFDYVFLRGLTAAGHRVVLSPHSDHDLVEAQVAAG
ncbi:endonuclease/exonuclease/phosphatase family protein [Streptomyces sp. NPDC097619]|uniref:endonuclease/exonuclease/phosphatase family protein n=1 Tax=Streptomyces sp. NPDC097619 TaxID=3157228 RepID=UPI00332E2469